MRDTDRNLLLNKINARTERLKFILKIGAPGNKHTRTEMQNDESARLEALCHQTVNADLYAMAEDELNQLKASLKWLKSDNAGVCDECGCHIPMNRLIAVPATRKCINCASGL